MEIGRVARTCRSSWYSLRMVKEEGILITKEKLNLAGWLSITSALFAIPSLAMYLFLGTIVGPGAKLAQAILTIVSLGLFLYIVTSFRKLLNSRFRFHDVDIYISLLIWVNVALSLFSLLALENTLVDWGMNILSTVGLIVQGIILIMFATRLLRLPYSLHSLLKPYSYVSIVSGICAITIILFWAAIIAGAVADAILGIIFFRAAEQPPSTSEMMGKPIE
jgi:hypothetical protein